MSSFVIKMNVYSKDTSMPIIDSSDLSFNELPAVESDAWESWALDGTDASLTGTINGRALTKQNTVTAGSGFFSLAIGSNVKNALLSGFTDNRIQTQAMVVRIGSLPANGAIPVIAGAFSSSVGSAIFMEYNSLSIRRQFRPTITATEQAYSSLMNAWLFIALSENGDASQMDSTLFCSTNGGTPYSVERTDAIAKAVATTGIGVGHVTYVTSTAQTTVNLDVAEYNIFSTAKSPSDLSAMYARAKRRMTARGMTLL